MTDHCCRIKRAADLGRLQRFGRGPVNVGSWHVRDVTPAATRAAERRPSRVERTYQRAARSCFVQDVVHSEHFRVVTPTSENSSLHAIFGSPDDVKFRSCMTLFSLATVDPDNPFRHALDRWCGGQPDEQTLA